MKKNLTRKLAVIARAAAILSTNMIPMLPEVIR